MSNFEIKKRKDIMACFLVCTGLVAITALLIALSLGLGGWPLLITIPLCIFLWCKGCSAHEDRLAEQARERIEALEKEKRLEEEARARQAEKEQQQRAKAAAQAQEKARREEGLRDFARAEMSPALQMHAEIGAEIKEQEARTARLRQTLEDLGKSVRWNSEYRAQNSRLKEMRELQEELWESIETAYLESVEYETSLGDKAFEARRKAIEDGRKDAESVAQRFEEMRKRK